MRNAMVQLCLVLIGVTSVHAVKLLKTAALHAKVLPSESAEKVWAVQGKDSVKMMGSDGEYYLTAINPGLWQIRVEARKPYQNATGRSVQVNPGADQYMGEIWLQK